MKRIIALALVVLFVILAWSGAWLFFSGEIKSTILAQAEADGVSAPRLSCANLSVGGFPFRFDIACVGAELVSGDVRAQLSELRGSVLVYQPTFFRFWAQGPLAISDAFTGSKSQLGWSALEMSARFNGFAINRISLIGDDLDWTDTLFANRVIASAGHFEIHLLDMPEQEPGALASYASVTGLNAPGLTLEKADVSIESEITGLPEDIRELAAPDLIARFRDAKGQLKLVRLHGIDGESFVEASGQFSLDDQSRLDGQLDLKSKGLVERLGGFFDPTIQPLIVGNPSEDGSYTNKLFVRAGVFVSGIVPLFIIPPLL